MISNSQLSVFSFAINAFAAYRLIGKSWSFDVIVAAQPFIPPAFASATIRCSTSGLSSKVTVMAERF